MLIPKQLLALQPGFFSVAVWFFFFYITIILSSFVLLSFSWSEIERSGIITGKFKAGVGSYHENSVYIDTLVHPRWLYSIAWHFKGMSITDLNGWLLLRFGYVQGDKCQAALVARAEVLLLNAFLWIWDFWITNLTWILCSSTVIIKLSTTAAMVTAPINEYMQRLRGWPKASCRESISISLPSFFSLEVQGTYVSFPLARRLVWLF